IPMSLAISCISSMNYFFLRHVTKKPGHDVDIINDELQNYLMNIPATEGIDKDFLYAIAEEIEEGDYFSNRTETEVRSMLSTSIQELVGENLSHIVDLYVQLSMDMGVLSDD